MTLLLLAAIGIVEAVVWLWRCRTANGSSAWRSTLATVGTTGTRLAFVWAGVSAVIAEVPWWLAFAAYVVPAAVATHLAHSLIVRQRGTP